MSREQAQRGGARPPPNHRAVGHIQREWYRLTSAGMESDEAAKRAAGAISFGRHRASRGYDEFHVDLLGLPEEVDLGPPYGVQEVPTGIKVTASKARGNE